MNLIRDIFIHRKQHPAFGVKVFHDKLTNDFPEWISNYVGIPFEEYNCWQLICKIYNEQFGIKLSDYSNEYKTALDKENIRLIYERELKIWQQIKNPAFGDIIVLMIQGQPWHTGIVVSKQFMLHTERKIQSMIESYNGIIWKNKIIGYYRYQTGQ